MQIIPAIDIKDGKVVRLTKGDFLKVEVYSEDPAEIAKKWQDAGAELIHLVDLDGARYGTLKNIETVRKLAKSVKVPIEFGGGIRDEESINRILKEGVSYVILGTKALDEKFLKSALDKFGDKIIVSIDSKDETVAIKGWQESGNTNPVKFAREMETSGVSRLIYTDVSKDGTLQGPNFFSIEKILDATNIEVVASGGISSVEDLRRLKSYEKKGLAGVIVGKAIYEGKINLKEAIKELA